MAQPRDVLVIDIPGLTVSDVQALNARTHNLRGLAREGWATLVPISAGFENARAATVATGVLPMHHGIVHSPQWQLRAPTFWQRAGLKCAYFGPSRTMQEIADITAFPMAEVDTFKPESEAAFLRAGAPKRANPADVDGSFAHYAIRAMESGCRVVWLEHVYLCVDRIIRIVKSREPTPEAIQRADEWLAPVLRAAKDRVVVLLSTTTVRRATHSLRIAEASTKTPGDWRLLHVRCETTQIPAVVHALGETGAYARVVHGSARGELGVDCVEAGTVVAELKPGWGFAPSELPAPCASGPDSPPQEMPVLLARGLPLEKNAVGMCEIAWMLEHVLTGREYRDDKV